MHNTDGTPFETAVLEQDIVLSMNKKHVLSKKRGSFNFSQFGCFSTNKSVKGNGKKYLISTMEDNMDAINNAGNVLGGSNKHYKTISSTSCQPLQPVLEDSKRSYENALEEEVGYE